jgi:multidrug efflux pump
MSGFNLSVWSLRNKAVVFFFMAVALLSGIQAFLQLGRAEDPVFTIRTMVVQARWPGATLDQTVRQVTERLERTLQETDGLDFLRSTTSPGETTIFVNLLGSTSGSEVPDIWYQVRKRVADMRHTLPQGVIGPGFNDEFGDTFGIIYGFTSDGFTQRQLRDAVEDARSKLLLVPDVSRIDVLGAQDEQIFVEFSFERIAALGLDRGALVATLQAQNVIRPAGVIRTGEEEIFIRISGAFENEQDIRDINFSVGGRILRLSDIADVRRGFAEPPQPLFRVNGEPAIGLAIAMKAGGDTLALGERIREAMAGIAAELPIGIEPILVADQPEIVGNAIGEFTTSLWQAIAIVLVVSLVALGLRAGAVVAVSIPLTLAIVFLAMQLASIDLQRVSLGALIIALALLVDDAMTTVDSMSGRLASGEDAEGAAGKTFSLLAAAMFSGTLITIAGFVPIGFAASSAGEYTFTIFAVVGMALVASWLVAVIFTPLIAALILRRPKAGEGAKPDGFAIRAYRSLLNGAMKVRWLTIAVTLGCFAAAIMALPLVPRLFFPPSDRVELLLDMRLPQNASIYASADTVKRIDEVLAADEDVARWSAYVGQGAVRFYLPLSVQLPSPSFAQAVIVTKSLAARDRVQKRLEAVLAEEFPSLVGRVYPLELGPPVGWPLQYRVSGPDAAELRRISLQLAQIMAGEPAARSVNFEWMAPARQLQVRVDQDEARRLGLSSEAVAGVLSTAITGTSVTQIRDDIYLVDVVLREAAGERLSVAALRNLSVPLPGGRTVPLSQVASFEYGMEDPVVWRRNRVSTLTVQADVAPGVLPETVVSAMAQPIEELRSSLPPGYQIALGGIAEESAASQASVFAVIPLMILIILSVLIVQLRSFGRLALVLSIVPLGLIGVVGALLLSRQPLGFVAILGMLALIGMIAKNAVILIEQVEAERRGGKAVKEAVIAASSSRFRPIMLTAVSTVLGLIPIAPTVFWGAMAFAIMGGLLVATLLTLILLPTLYVTFYGGRNETKAAGLEVGDAA